MKRMYKLNCLALTLIFLTSVNAYATMPTTVLDAQLFNPYDNEKILTPDGELLMPFERVLASLRLGYFSSDVSIEEIKTVLKESEKNMSFKGDIKNVFSFKEARIDKNIQLLIVTYNTNAEITIKSHQLHRPTAMYIFQNGKYIGHSVSSTLEIFNPQKAQLYSTIQQLSSESN